jgi:cytochrome c oxidase subunit III
MPNADLATNPVLPVGGQYRHSTGIWGMWTLIGTEAALFAYLLFSYFYVASQHAGRWPPFGPPELLKASINTVLLLLSSVCAWWAERSAKGGRRGPVVLGLLAALVLGSVFTAIQLSEWRSKPFELSTDGYSSLYYTITGFHLMHVAVGLLMLLVLLCWAALGYFTERRHAALSVGVLYWHFVDAVWLVVFSALFVVPHLG